MTAFSSKLGHDPVSEFIIQTLPLSSIFPSPENDDLYRPIDVTEPEFKELVKGIRRDGIKDPLVITLDNYILSGHRRHAAAQRAGLQEAPCRRENILRSDPNFVRLLREYNRQRIKSIDEHLREQVLDAEPEEAYRALLQHRESSSRLDVEGLEIEGEMKRSRISKAKEPFLQSVLQVLEARRDFWPLSVRQIHYALLNMPPLIHASKPDSVYCNNLPSYKSLCDLTTRARLARRIPMRAISDETRPCTNWAVHDAPASFFRQELNDFLKGYRRNLQQSQPNHIEIVGEKLTVQSIIKPVAGIYNIPFTIGRGFSSLEPRYKMADRFRKSGKEQLILLVLSDFDPSGEEIFQSFARSLRDDFGIWNIQPFKVAITQEQVDRYQLPPMLQAKSSDSRSRKFQDKHGDNVWELEALPPEALQHELSETIDRVMDTDRFNAELEQEKQDAAYLATLRQRAHFALNEATKEQDDE